MFGFYKKVYEPNDNWDDKTVPDSNFTCVAGNCRFYPTCSQYTVEALKGMFLKGLSMGIKEY